MENVKEEAIQGRVSELGEQPKAFQGLDDVQVDITTCTCTNATRTAVDEDPDATEYSSSFVDTTSDTEKGSGLSEPEVDSQFFGDSDLTSPYDAYRSMFQTRKKKLTNHWRSFIRPLMWRCKWAEIKIKEIESQAWKYARILSAHENRKHPGVYQLGLEGHCSKSLPFTNQFYRNKAIKRRKRKREEDANDPTIYTSEHALFSYLENKKSNQDAFSVLDDFVNSAAVTVQHADCNDKFGIDHNQLFFNFKDGDDSLERILWKIEIVQSRVRKLKTQLDLVMPKNAIRFSSSENLSLLAPFDAQTSSAPSPTFSAGNGETFSVGAVNASTQIMSGYDLGDFVRPESAISSYREAINVPDIFESTVALLAAADVSFHQPKIGDSCEDIVDNILIDNKETDVKRHALGGTSEQLVQEHYQLVKVKEEEEHHQLVKVKDEEATTTYPTPASKVNTIVMTSIVPKEEEPKLQSCLSSDFQFGGSKRRRGERKAGSVGWSKKSSDEPDSQ